MRGVYVAIEGATGVGKTTLAERLALPLDATAVLDPFGANPFLPQLLASGQPTQAQALRVELTFFALRVAQLHDIAALLVSGRNVVADWALLKQPIFAATTLAPADAARIASTVDAWAGGLPTPDALIALSASAATLRSRVRERGRDMEAGLEGAQLASLATAFEAAYTAWPWPLIRVDADTFDAFDERHVHDLAAQVRQRPIPLEMR
jgi:deoxyguanosine kinase